MQVILNQEQIGQLLEQISDEIVQNISIKARPALVGIRSRGETLALRMRNLLRNRGFPTVDYGTLDITMYRDDLNQMGSSQPEVRSTEIDFNVDDRLIILVDDVLSTGRSARAALDALMDLGRPCRIQLAVLIDRNCAELPIRADYVGKVVSAPPEQRIHVYLQETDNREEVVIE